MNFGQIMPAEFINRLEQLAPDLWEALLESLHMVLASTLLALFFGFWLAVLLMFANPRGLNPRPRVYRLLDLTVNLVRSFPFVILLIAIIPFTRLVVGTTIGSGAAVVPLVVAAAPFAARLIEASFLEVDRGVLEAARSFGAGNWQIVFRVLLPEALPSIILNAAVVGVALVGYSAMAGIVGGGGLGDLAIKYGYNRFEVDVMIYAVIILLVLVQAVQMLGNRLYRAIR